MSLSRDSLFFAAKLIIQAYLLFFAACANGGAVIDNRPPSSTIASNQPFTFRLSLPGYPNRSFSAYIFSGGALVGAVRSNTKTDAQGNLTVTASRVDANNCVTTGALQQNAGASYSIHVRLDGAGSGSFVYPSACPGDAGFLNMANLAYAQIYSASQLYWPMQLNWLSTTATIYYSFFNTGLSATRLTYCSVVDGQIATPSIYTSSTLGYSQGNVTFTGGSGNAMSTFFVPYASSGMYKYTCWIDANNSGTYNSGDLVGTSTDSYALSSWTAVP